MRRPQTTGSDIGGGAGVEGERIIRSLVLSHPGAALAFNVGETTLAPKAVGR